MSRTSPGQFRPMRVYISSTALDLQPFRQSVIAAIRKLGHDRFAVVCMEDYTSEDSFPADKCIRDVAECDTYVGLFGFRYGYVPPGYDLSITESEYREALAKGKRILIFLASEEGAIIARKHIDREATRIDRLRQELATEWLIHDFFKTPEDAASQVLTSLTRLTWPPVKDALTSPSEARHPELWMKRYLEWVVATHSMLDLPGIRGATHLPIKLAQVYVALRGNQAGPYELAHSRDLLEEELAELHAMYRELSDAERRKLRAELLRHNPHMLSLIERDRPKGQHGTAGRTVTVNLAEAFRHERWLVILGDPGSGKTTLGRWLALKLAEALVHSPEGEDARVRVPAFQVNPEMPYDSRLIDLGPARLPVLVRIAKFAQALASSRKAGETLLLVDWLSDVSWNERPPTAGEQIPRSGLDELFRHCLNVGRTVVILDGMDEITEATDRADVVLAIEQFVRDWIPAQNLASLNRTEQKIGGPVAIGLPYQGGGNQLVVTSRIAGYHAAPLTATAMTHVTIEPMGRSAVEHFCDAWMREVYKILNPQLSIAAYEGQAQLATDGLTREIFDPERPSIQEIASNPLLVTLLASLYLKRGASLPGNRVELYQTAIEMLIEDWRDTGLTLEEALFVLDPLANYIHERYPTGLIEESELRQIVTEHLAMYRDLPTLNPPPKLAEAVRAFVEQMRDQVGLIAARGEQLYGFLHLTFQEYLAGRHLARNPLTAAAAISERMSDSRWREPVLLALGYGIWKWTPSQRLEVLNKLLVMDDPLGSFLPRMALLIVDAFPEMKGLPEESLRLLLRRLLNAYSDRDTMGRFPMLRKRIEDAFLRVRRFGNRTLMDEVFAEAIRTPATPELAPAAAALVREHEWLTPVLVEALADGVENDGPAWGWPVEQCQRDLASLEVPRLAPKKALSPDEELRKIQRQLRSLETSEVLARTTLRVAELEPSVGRQREELVRLKAELAELDYAVGALGTSPGKSGGDDLLKEKERNTQRKSVVQAQVDEYERLSASLVELRAESQQAREKLLEELDRAQLKQRKAELEEPREHERGWARYYAAVRAGAVFDLRQAQRIRSPLPATDLRLRSALERNSQLMSHVNTSVHWMAAIAAVYGGYPNCRAAETARAFHDIARLLSKEDAERDRILDSDPDTYAPWFGDGDPIYEMAVYLDTGMGGRQALANSPVVFTPSAMYRNSALDQVLGVALKFRKDLRAVVRDLHQVWQDHPTSRGKADAVATLIILGEDVTGELTAALDDPARRSDAEGILAHLSRVADFLSDAVYRSRKEIERDLADLDETAPSVWVDIVDTILRELVAAGRVSIPVSGLTKRAPPPYFHALKADEWYASANEDDPVKAVPDIVSTMPSADMLITLLAAAYRAPNRRLAKLGFRWDVDPLPPRFIDEPSDIPLEALAALRTFHLGEVRPDFELKFFEAAIKRLAARLEPNPDLRPELAAFALEVGCFSTAAELIPQLRLTADPYALLLDLTRRIAGPYQRARGLAAVIPLCPEADRLRLVEEVRESAREITDAFRRTRVQELLIEYGGEGDRAAMLEEVIASALEIIDADNRCRALVRLVRWATGGLAGELCAAALDAGAMILDENHRSETLRLIHPFLPNDTQTRFRWHQAVGTLSTGHGQARATNKLGLFFLREAPESLAAKVGCNPQLWAPIMAVAGIHDVLSSLGESPKTRGLWTAIRARPGDHAFVAQLLALGIQEGLPLSRDAASAIHELFLAGEQGSLLMLLPLLQGPSPDAAVIIERLKSHANNFISQHATLFLAEDGRKLNDRSIPALIDLLSGRSDRSRYRAQLVLGSRSVLAERTNPQLALSRFGVHNREIIAEAEVESFAHDVRVYRALRSMAYDVVFDTEAPIRAWVAQCDQPDIEGARSQEILRSIFALTDDAWPALLDGLKNGSSVARIALLQSLCGLVTLKERIPVRWIQPLIATLRSLASEPFLEFRVLPNVFEPGIGRNGPPDVKVLEHSAQVVASVAMEIAETDSSDLVMASRAADKAFLARTTSFAEVLREPREIDLLAWLASIGSNFFTWADGSDAEVEGPAAQIRDHPQAFALLVRWLTETLSAQRAESLWMPKSEPLLRLTASVARRLPSAFVRLADGTRLEPLLVRAAEHQKGRYGRRAAVVLLSHLGRVTPRMVRTFMFALQDDRFVQDATVEAIQRCRDLRPDALTPLMNGLEDDSAVVAFGSARMLSAIARQERIGAAQRNEIQAALTAAIRNLKSHRGVYRLFGKGTSDEEPLRIACLDRLDQVYYQAILEITGVIPFSQNIESA